MDSAQTEISIYTMYDHPLDFPNHVVVREYRITDKGIEAQADAELFKSVELARKKMVERGLTLFPRHIADDPFIVESWI